MMAVIYIVVAVVILGALYVVFPTLTDTYWGFRGIRLVKCPENNTSAAVVVDAGFAACTAIVGYRTLRVKDCSRWPARRECNQGCLNGIAAAPEACLVSRILTTWYEEKSCGYCGEALGEIHGFERKPALMSPEGRTVEWFEVPPETLPELLSTHLPMCWNCHIAPTCHRNHPKLVMERHRRWVKSPSDQQKSEL